MSTLRLGRLVLDSTNVKVTKATFGDGLSLGFRAHQTAGDSGAGIFTLRQQMQGQEGKLIALTWSTDDKWDGFYVLRRVSADVVHAAPQDHLTIFDFSVDLERSAIGLVDFESTLTGATLTNVHALPGNTPWVATPVNVDGLHSNPEPVRLRRASPLGDVRIWTNPGRHSVWSSDASKWYGGAAEVRQNLAIVTGRFPVDPPGIFELSNGLCRVRWIVGEVLWESIDGTWDDMGDLTWDQMGGVSGVEVATWNGSAWVGKGWDIGIVPTRVAVTRNDPHVCSVRLIQELSVGRRVVDMTMRRGASWVHVHHHGRAEARSVLRSTAEAATAIDGGVKASAATDLVTYVAATSHTKTNDLAQGGFTQASSDRFTFMVGGAYQDTPEELVDRWVSYRGEEVRAVLR